MKSTRLLLALLSAVVGASCKAQPRPPAAKKPLAPVQAVVVDDDKGWKVDDVVEAESARDFRISRDGKWVVWTKRSPDREKGVFVEHLMLSSLADSTQIQLTRGADSCRHPRWSPNGKTIAFLSSRPAPKKSSDKGNAARRDDEDEDDDAGGSAGPKGGGGGKSQLWLINPAGGEPWPLTELDRDVRDFDWIDDDSLLAVAQEKKSLRSEKLKKKDDVEVVDDEVNEPPARLWKIDAKDGGAQRFSDNRDRIGSIAVSPNGAFAVAIHERSLSYTYDNKVRPSVVLHDLKKKTSRRIFDGAGPSGAPKYNISGVHWQSDSRGFYAANQYTNHPKYLNASVLRLEHFEVAGGGPTPVELDWPRGLAESSAVAPVADGFLALLADGVQHRLARYNRVGKGWRRQPIDMAHLQSLTVSADGKLVVYEKSSSFDPPRWFRATPASEKLADETLVVDVKAKHRDKPRAKAEAFRWNGAKGEQVEGVLFRPLAVASGKRAPLVVMIHGGPFGADGDAWMSDWVRMPNLFTSRGAYVLMPNYHGSSQYGLDFGESIADGHYYDLPLEDIEKGIDALVAKGLVDRDRIGLTGWSNGAILSTALATRRHYKCAAVGAGGSEWVGDWGVCEFGMSFSNYYLGKAPYEDPELYRKNAPFFDFPKVRTPMLIFHGTEDRAVPTHHGWMQFRVLQQIGKTDVRFLLFPGEKHSFAKIAHQKRKVEEELAWFDKYLFAKPTSEDPSLKEGSPLANALALAKAARESRNYGRRINGVLTPETVSFKGLEIGRFEVTRAQFREFDRKYAVEPGTENHPANGVSLQQAKAYCEWLSKRTGGAYRLGSKKELEDVYGKAGAAENTFDEWAGYAANPEDKARLQNAVRQLNGAAALLKSVGSSAPKGSSGVFDLGGNVAEWTSDGATLGGSADRTIDETEYVRPDPKYVGFRVMKAAARSKPK